MDHSAYEWYADERFGEYGDLSYDQSVNRLGDGHLFEQTVDQSIDQSFNQPISHSCDQSLTIPTENPVCRRNDSQSSSHSISQLINQSLPHSRSAEWDSFLADPPIIDRSLHHQSVNTHVTHEHSGSPLTDRINQSNPAHSLTAGGITQSINESTFLLPYTKSHNGVAYWEYRLDGARAITLSICHSVHQVIVQPPVCSLATRTGNVTCDETLQFTSVRLPQVFNPSELKIKQPDDCLSNTTDQSIARLLDRPVDERRVVTLYTISRDSLVKWRDFMKMHKPRTTRKRGNSQATKQPVDPPDPIQLCCIMTIKYSLQLSTDHSPNSSSLVLPVQQVTHIRPTTWRTAREFHQKQQALVNRSVPPHPDSSLNNGDADDRFTHHPVTDRSKRARHDDQSLNQCLEQHTHARDHDVVDMGRLDKRTFSDSVNHSINHSYSFANGPDVSSHQTSFDGRSITQVNRQLETPYLVQQEAIHHLQTSDSLTDQSSNLQSNSHSIQLFERNPDHYITSLPTSAFLISPVVDNQSIEQTINSSNLPIRTLVRAMKAAWSTIGDRIARAEAVEYIKLALVDWRNRQSINQSINQSISPSISRTPVHRLIDYPFPFNDQLTDFSYSPVVPIQQSFGQSISPSHIQSTHQFRLGNHRPVTDQSVIQSAIQPRTRATFASGESISQRYPSISLSRFLSVLVQETIIVNLHRHRLIVRSTGNTVFDFVTDVSVDCQSFESVNRLKWQQYHVRWRCSDPVCNQALYQSINQIANPSDFPGNDLWLGCSVLNGECFFLDDLLTPKSISRSECIKLDGTPWTPIYNKRCSLTFTALVDSNQSINNQSVNNQSISNQSVSKFTTPPIHHSTSNQSTMNQSTNVTTSQSVFHQHLSNPQLPVPGSSHTRYNKPVDQLVNQSVSQSISQSSHPWLTTLSNLLTLRSKAVANANQPIAHPYFQSPFACRRSITESTNQSASQSINQPFQTYAGTQQREVSQLFQEPPVYHEDIKIEHFRSVHQSINQPINQSLDRASGFAPNYDLNLQSWHQSTSQSVNHYQSHDHSRGYGVSQSHQYDRKLESVSRPIYQSNPDSLR